MTSETDVVATEAASSESRRFWQLVAATGGAQYYGLIAGIATLILTARWLGPDGRGLYVASVGWATAFATVGHLSLGQVAAYGLTPSGDPQADDARLARVVGTLLVSSVAITLGCWMVGIGLALSGSQMLGELPLPLFLGALLIVPGFLLEHYVTSLLLAVGRVGVINTSQIVGRTLQLALLVVGWFFHADVPWVIAALGIAQGVIVGVGVRVLLRTLSVPARFCRRQFGRLLRDGLRLHLNYVGDVLMASTGVLLVNAAARPSDTAYFQLAVQVVTALAVLPHAAALVSISQVVRLGHVAGWEHQRRTLVVLLAMLVVTCVATAAAVPTAVPMVFGEEFAPAVPAVWILLTTVPVIALSRVLAPQWLSRGLYLPLALVTCVAGITNVVLARWLVPIHGATGAAAALALAYMPVVVAQGGMLAHCERHYRRAKEVASR